MVTADSTSTVESVQVVKGAYLWHTVQSASAGHVQVIICIYSGIFRQLDMLITPKTVCIHHSYPNGIIRI
jgi:hypothetical protein